MASSLYNPFSAGSSANSSSARSTPVNFAIFSFENVFTCFAANEINWAPKECPIK